MLSRISMKYACLPAVHMDYIYLPSSWYVVTTVHISQRDNLAASLKCHVLHHLRGCVRTIKSYYAVVRPW